MAIGETDHNCIKSFKKPIMYEKGVETMKSRYIIGFFGAFLILGMLLAAGYRLTYEAECSGKGWGVRD